MRWLRTTKLLSISSRSVHPVNRSRSRRLDRTAVVRLSPRLVGSLPDLSDPALERAARGVPPDADGSTTVTLPVDHDAAAVRLLIGHGGEVEVLSPDSLRDALVARAPGRAVRVPAG